MKIRKRNGQEVKFTKTNIIKAIKQANDVVNIQERLTDLEIKEIANEIEEKCKNSIITMNVEDIQNLVEHAIFEKGKFELAKEYISYRYIRNLERRKNTTDDRIISLLNNNNEEIHQENANKNPNIVSTMRDYMAGEVSKDISRRYLIPKDIIKAHDEGVIHFHDMDYFSMPMHNCFGANEELITDTGIRKFCSFSKNGESTYVKDKDGKFRLATVKCYGMQSCNKVTLTTRTDFKKEVIVTPNHRWILQDGTVTTNLKVGDVLSLTPDSTAYNITTRDEARAWCIGFIVGDGCDHYAHTQARLCGYKNQYVKYFEMAGFLGTTNETGDCVPYTKFFSKQDFLNGKAWRYMSVEQKALVFNGYYAADGNQDRNSICTTDDRIAEMIEELSGIAGYYIMHRTENVNSTNYKDNVRYINFKFLTKTIDKYGWKVANIESYQNGKEKQVWCVEEPITHSFTLANGVVTGNCCLINLDDMLQNGTVISGTSIDKPKLFSTACNIASQIVAQVASSQYGGQTITASHLSKFVKDSRKYFYNNFKESLPDLSPEQLELLVENETKRDIKNGIQTLQYQLITLQTTNGQTPFVTLNLYLNEAENETEKEDLAIVIEEVLKQRIKGVKNEVGAFYANPFPKLIYVLEEDNISEDSKYYYLTKLAAVCTTKRMVPDYVSEKTMLKLKIDKNGNGNCYPPMGCRSFLTPFVEPETKKPKYYGRFNAGVVTINLPDVALSSKGNIELFWSILEDRLELCHRALKVRHEHLRNIKSDVAPILWQHGALARLDAGETIDNLLYNGYSTISLGYAGLYECVYYLTGKSHTDSEVTDFSLSILEKLNEKTAIWKKQENIDYSVYGTPIENTTEKFSRCLKSRFGNVKGVTDKNYITNSYHIPVFEKIDAFSKLQFESKFQDLSPGGAISYIETSNLENNLEAVLSVLKYIYNNIMYAEINCKLDWCHECGATGTIDMYEDNSKKLKWKCNNCGNEDNSKMNVIRRLCGYLSNSNTCCQGRMQDINERVEHLN